MVIFGAMIVALLISVASIMFFCRKKTASACVKIILTDTIFITLATFAIVRFGFGIEKVFWMAHHDLPYFFCFMLATLLVGLACLFIKGIAEGYLAYEEDTPKRKVGSWILRIVSAVFFCLGVAAFTGTIWGKEVWGDIAPDEMLVTLMSPTGGTSDEIMHGAFEGPLLATALLTALFCLIVFPAKKLVYKGEEKITTVISSLAVRIISFVLAVCVAFGGLAYGVKRFELDKLVKGFSEDSKYIETHYVDPGEVKMQFPKEKRNLVHIYLESVENTYFSKELGGYMQQNLMPELTELTKEGTNFSHLPKGYGGPRPSSGGTWSVASMVNMGFGIPMKVPTDGNSYGTPGNFIPGAYSIGDILKNQGYEQTVMFGADADFGGLTYYFKSHGDFNIIDYKGALDRGLIPQGYHVWWGYEDSKLFEFAKNELTRLYETGKPFHLTMETADTHFPDGYVEPGMPTPFESQYANVIANSTKQAVEFVRWIQKQPFGDNTTIVITGDHLSMDKKFFADFDKEYQRTTYNLILNPAPGVADNARTQNRVWGSFDMFPTVLSSMGVKIEGDRLGLGTNLYSEKPTIFEEDGFDTVNEEFRKNSNFYYTTFLLGRKGKMKGNNITQY